MMAGPAAPFHPTIPPCSLANIKLAGDAPRRKEVVSLKMMPVGAPGPSAVFPHCWVGVGWVAGPGILTMRLTALPLPSNSVESPVPLSDTQNGLVGDATRPQGLTRHGSRRSASPAISDTRLCCAYLFAAVDQPADVNASIPAKRSFRI